MNLTFRTKLTGMVFILILTAVSGSTLFFLELYQRDKMKDVLRNELSNIQQATDQLNNLLQLVDLVEVEKAKVSKNIILLHDSPCNRTNTSIAVLSQDYEKRFQEMQISPSVWIESLSLFKMCTLMNNAPPRPSSQALHVMIVPTKVQIMEPYLPVLVQGARGIRFALLSMDGFQSSEASTLFIVDAQGKRLWSADGDEFADSAMIDTGLTSQEVEAFAKATQDSPSPHVLKAGQEGIVSYAKAGDEWTLISLSYEPVIFKPVQYAMRQSLYLALGFVLFCLFAGKNMAMVIVRPLNELKRHAERLGRGEFSERIEVQGSDEISIVKTAFNVMTEKILALIDQAKATINLERDLELAQEMQFMLLPEKKVQAAHHNLYGYVKTFDKCGGDWWGYLEVERKNCPPLLIVIVGDVTGHGTPSALITATVRGGLAVLKSWIVDNSDIASDPRLINQHLNRTVFEAAKGKIQMTLFTAVIDVMTQKMFCSNAGHNPPYLVTPGKSPDKAKLTPLGRPGIPLGQRGDTDYLDLDIYPWVQGSKLFLYTDGLIDCMVEEKTLYGKKQLRKALEKFGSLTGEKMMAELLRERTELIQDLPPVDDVTAVVCELRDT